MKKSLKWTIIIALILIVVVVGYFIFKNPSMINANNPGNTKSGNIQTTPIHDIVIQNFAFSPLTITINKGDTVIWTNMDSTAHTVTSDSGSELSSSTFTKGGTYSHTFNTVGTFSYHCSIHTSMKGKVIVQ